MVLFVESTDKTAGVKNTEKKCTLCGKYIYCFGVVV